MEVPRWPAVGPAPCGQPYRWEHDLCIDVTCLTLAKSDFQITPRFTGKIRNKSEFCCIALMEFHRYSIARATEK